VHEVEIPKAALKALAKASAAIRIHDDAKQGISTILQGIEEYKVKFAHDLAVEIRDSGGRPLILTLRKDTAAKLGSMLSCPVVTGDTSVDHRAAMLCASDCGVATLYSVTTGIDLTHFDSIIMVGLDWLPSTILQGEARIHRIGSQYASISIHYLIGRGTLDEVVRERVLERLDTFSAVIGTGDEAVFAEELGGGNEEDLIASFLERLRT
jgi:hypothetical protein